MSVKNKNRKKLLKRWRNYFDRREEGITFDLEWQSEVGAHGKMKREVMWVIFVIGSQLSEDFFVCLHLRKNPIF
jgi:hypothetical protein